MIPDILKLPNLISIGRLLWLIPTGYFLSLPGPHNRFYALACLAIAASSDFFDGYFARKLNLQTKLGLILDPLSDKVLATTLTALLIIYRAFPLWLAIAIISRDLLIVIGSITIKTRINEVPRSNLTGKYSFAVIAVLLISYIIEFDFGIRLFTALAIMFIILSIALYGHRLLFVLRGEPYPIFPDKLLYRRFRVTGTVLVSGLYLWQLLRYFKWL